MVRSGHTRRFGVMVGPHIGFLGTRNLGDETRDPHREQDHHRSPTDHDPGQPEPHRELQLRTAVGPLRPRALPALRPLHPPRLTAAAPRPTTGGPVDAPSAEASTRRAKVLMTCRDVRVGTVRDARRARETWWRCRTTRWP